MRKLTAKVVVGLMVVAISWTGSMNRAEAATYSVQPGDSLWTIARKHDTTVNDLKHLNNSWTDAIYVGQRLQVPDGRTTPGWIYTVKPGDSLWGIAKNTGVSVQAIQQTNGLSSSLIQVGQSLTIPATGSVASTTLRTTTSVPHYTQAELDYLARIIYAEARGESYNGQVAVGAVLLNRVRDKRFPNTVKGVIFQKNAFETVSNGQIWLKPDATAYRAARTALSGQDPTHGALFFYNPAKIPNPDNWIWTRRVTLKIGNHNFAV